MKKFLVVILTCYRSVVSSLYGQTCRYYPSCSAYALTAVEVHGAVKGPWIAMRRLGRCHPWCEGGVDFVPAPENYRWWGRAEGTDERYDAERPPLGNSTWDDGGLTEAAGDSSAALEAPTSFNDRRSRIDGTRSVTPDIDRTIGPSDRAAFTGPLRPASRHNAPTALRGV